MLSMPCRSSSRRIASQNAALAACISGRLYIGRLTRQCDSGCGSGIVGPVASRGVAVCSRSPANQKMGVARRPVALLASSIAQPLPDAEPRRFVEHRATQRDIRERQAAVPEQDGLVLSLAPGFLPGDDLAHLGVQRRLRELARLAAATARCCWKLPLREKSSSR